MNLERTRDMISSIDVSANWIPEGVQQIEFKMEVPSPSKDIYQEKYVAHIQMQSPLDQD